MPARHRSFFEKRYARKQEKASEEVDQLERECLVTQSPTALDRSLADDRIGRDDELGADGSAIERDAIFEDEASDIVNEIIRRSIDMGDAYPFELAGAAMTERIDARHPWVYRFCLLVSEYSSTREWTEASRFFEHLSANIVARVLFASNGIGTRVGYPRIDGVESGGFASDIDALGAQLPFDEFNRRQSAGYSVNPSDDLQNDLGIDFVSSRVMPDRRVGSLVVVGQAACGQNYDLKLNEASESKLGRYWGPLAYHSHRLLRSFTLSHCVPNELQLGELSEQAGFFFDRGRLVSALLEDGAAEAIEPLQMRCEELTAALIALR